MSAEYVDTEMATLDLGDRRRTRRAKQLMRAIAKSPGDSFPNIFPGEAELEACYRLQNSEHVSFDDFAGAHGNATWGRAKVDSAPVLVLHDTTEVIYDSDGERVGLTQKANKQSYHAHVSLAVAEGELPVVYGVVGLLPTIQRDGTWYEVTPEDKEDKLWVGSQRWWLAAEQTRSSAPSELPLIHVMDREADSYSLLGIVLEQGDDFVVRSVHDRKLAGGGTLVQALSSEEPMGTREVQVGMRGGKRPPATKKAHPDRQRREAKLTVRARQVTLARPPDVEPMGEPQMPLWVVEAIEESPPQGQPAVHWRLLTTLPTEDLTSALRVVDIYRKRWLIEELFKALKTGCSLTKRQARSRATLLTILGMMLPLAVRLLSLRTLERAAPKTPAAELFDPIELAALRKLVPKARLPKNPTLTRALAAVAKLGGHRQQNGRPGWMVLGRGLEKLMDYAAGWRGALKAMEEGELDSL